MPVTEKVVTSCEVPKTPIAATAITVIAGKSPNPGDYQTINGEEYWVEPDGYAVKRKFVLLYPGWYGPLAVDPDHGHGDEECNDALSGILAKLQGFASWNDKVTNYNGMYSTNAERHCSEAALSIVPDIKSSADVPPCPKFWISETHYWVGHIAIGRELDKYTEAKDESAAMKTVKGLLTNEKVLAMVGTAAAAGAAALPTVVKIILSALGVST